MLSQNKISNAEAEPYIIIVNIKEKVLKIILSYIVCVGVSFGHTITGHQKQQVPSLPSPGPPFDNLIQCYVHYKRKNMITIFYRFV